MRMKMFGMGWVSAGLFGSALLVGCLNSSEVTGSDANSALRMSGAAPGAVSDSSGTTKVVVCHIPPGNPANAHSITVGSPAVKAHLAHGDVLGECQDTSSTSDEDTSSTTGGSEEY